MLSSQSDVYVYINTYKCMLAAAPLFTSAHAKPPGLWFPSPRSTLP